MPQGAARGSWESVFKSADFELGKTRTFWTPLWLCSMSLNCTPKHWLNGVFHTVSVLPQNITVRAEAKGG